jgi:hypothetical protein
MPRRRVMENPGFMVHESPILINEELPMWSSPTWTLCKTKAEEIWDLVQREAEKSGRGIHPNVGIRIVPIEEAIETRRLWFDNGFNDE